MRAHIRLAILFSCLVTNGSLAQTFRDPFPHDEATSVAGGSQGNEVLAIAIDPRNHLTVYAGTSRGIIFKSTNGGQSWVNSSFGLPLKRIKVLTVNPSDPKILYAGTDGGGVYKTRDAAGNWARVDSGFRNDQIFSIVIDPSNPETLYVGTLGGGVLKSENGGTSWRLLDLGVANAWVSALAIDPRIPSIVYAATGGDNHHLRTYGIFKTTDGGQTWNPINSGFPISNWIFSMVVDPSAPETVYVGTYSRQGLYKTTDGGQHWFPVEPTPNPYPDPVYALGVDPTDSSSVYVGYGSRMYGRGGISKTEDGGRTWLLSTADREDTPVFAMAIDSTNPATIYAGTARGVLKSIDGGDSWQAAGPN